MAYRKNFFVFILVFGLGSLVWLGGCRGKAEPNHSATTASPVTVSAETSAPVPQNPQKLANKLERPTDLTPRQLLKKTVTAYKAAFSYSDHGQVSIVAKMLDPDVRPEPWPCTVAFQRGIAHNGNRTATKLRLEVGDGKLVSDGVDVFAQIQPMPEQVLRFAAPESLTIESLFQDIYLDQSMELGIPETILRFPPQLVLLLAHDPLKTLLPEKAQAELREPQWIGDIPCDLVRVTDEAGSRLLWISRENHALMRFEYFVEGQPVPEGVDSLRLVRIDMPDARLNWEITEEAFQMQQPMEARQVAEFLPSDLLAVNSTDRPSEEEKKRFLTQLDSHRKEHRAMLQAMTERDVFALPAHVLENDTAPKPVSAKAPKSFTLTPAWNHKLTGAAQVAVLRNMTAGTQEDATVKHPPVLLVPYEGNLLAVINFDGKILKQAKPDGLLNDELVTIVRQGFGPAGRPRVGLSSLSGKAVHVYDCALDHTLKLVTSYLPGVLEKDSTASNRPRQLIADFCFANMQGGDSEELLAGVVSIDETNTNGDSFRAVDLEADTHGKEIWRDDSVSSPIQVDSCHVKGRQVLLGLSDAEQGTGNELVIYDTEGRRKGTVRVGDNRRIFCFGVDKDTGRLCVISCDADQRDLRLERIEPGETEGSVNVLWSRPILGDSTRGENDRQSADQLVCGDLIGDERKEWIVAASDGTIHVLGDDGTPLDSFAFGKVVADLAVVGDGVKRLLIVADAEGVSAWNVGVPDAL